ncbi:MAG: AAA family ATPase [Snowella sp.]|nr:AAA family ATPase [Snowella sp.]
MTSDRLISARWIQDFEKQLYRRRHLILYGNIHDQFLWRGAYLGIQDFLQTYFQDLGFGLISRYDPIDGSTFAQETMRTEFDRLTQQALHPNPVSPNPPVSPSPLSPPPRRSPAANVPRQVNQRIIPEEAFGNLRVVVKQEKIPTATVIDLGDMLTTDGDRYPTEERNALILLKKCTLEAAIVREGNLTGYRNTLIILASDLNRVPVWFHANNPHVSIIQVTRPNKEERKQFILRFGREGFYRGQQARPDASELASLAEDFAELTDGFQTLELEALRHTSHREKLPLSQKELIKLVDFYKFGQKEEPFEQINAEKISQAREQLTRSVLGQNHAVEAVTNMLTNAKVGISMSQVSGRNSKPKGVFFFGGPTGVGKTELAKSLSRLIFGDEEAFLRFDMSEYKEEHAAEKLAGAPPGFVGYEEGGQLTNKILERPYRILLCDEIEKAHPKILDKFLQILEDGRLTDGKGQTAYFNQTVIIFTSNIGASDLSDPQTGTVIRPGIMNQVQAEGVENFSYEQVQSHFQEEVKWYFTSRIGRAELLNRLGDNVVVFDLLRPNYVAGIGNKFLRQLSESAWDKYQLKLTFEPSIIEGLNTIMEQQENLLFGGRRIKSLLESLVERPLNRWLFEHYPDLNLLMGKALSLGFNPSYHLVVRE